MSDGEYSSYNESEIEERYDDGTILVRETEVFRVITPQNQSIELLPWELGKWDVLKRRAGEFTLTETPDTIPVTVARIGKPAMATYLQIIHGLNQDEIAEKLNLRKRTVRQYLSKFRHGQR